MPAQSRSIKSLIALSVFLWRLQKLSEEDDLLYQMERALWEGQKDRHGSAVVQTQTRQEAEVAITLACSTIQLFNIEHGEND